MVAHALTSRRCGWQSADGMGPLLAPVDLDLAFSRPEYFANTTGKRDDEEFLANVAHERAELRNNLAGSTASTGLADMEGGKGLSTHQAVLRWALRDTLISAYDAGAMPPYPPCGTLPSRATSLAFAVQQRSTRRRTRT